MPDWQGCDSLSTCTVLITEPAQFRRVFAVKLALRKPDLRQLRDVPEPKDDDFKLFPV